MDETTNPNPEPETPHGQRPKAADVLHEWGFDFTAFQAKAKQSMDAARGDMSEITGTLRQALASTKQVLVDLERTKRPVATELKTGFERAWDEIENAFARARQRMREEKPTEESEPAEQPQLIEKHDEHEQ